MQAQPRPPLLSQTIEAVETHHKTVRVLNFTGTRAELSTIVDHMAPHSVDVAVETDPDRPRDVVDLLWQGSVQATSPAAAVLEHARAWETSMSTGLAREPPAVLARLADTFFESFDKRRMVMASRIVEFRAWNAGGGTLHAGFQDLAKLSHQRSTYENLTNSGVEVHVHGVPDRATTADLDLHVHESTSDEVAAHWWVAFDGDGDDDEKALLLAAERDPDQFYGFWTYDAGVADAALARSEWLAGDATHTRPAVDGAAGD